MSFPDNHRRTLLKSLYSTERLMHLFKRSSYYSEEPSRTFLNSLWKSVETGSTPPAATTRLFQKYLKSDAIPDEEDCCDIDLAAQYFISALRMLASFAQSKNTDHLEYIANEVEGSYINELSIDELNKDSGKNSILITREVRQKADSLPIKVNFLRQLEIDSQKARHIPLQRNAIEASKFGSIDEISARSSNNK